MTVLHVKVGGPLLAAGAGRDEAALPTMLPPPLPTIEGPPTGRAAGLGLPPRRVEPRPPPRRRGRHLCTVRPRSTSTSTRRPSILRPSPC